MGKTAQRMILTFNRLFTRPNRYFDTLARSPEEAFEYSIRSGRVVYEQFHGFNDFTGKRVLDYGCGGGGKTIHYARQGAASIVGTDFQSHYTLACEYAARE